MAASSLLTLTATAIVAANLRVDGKLISDAASGPPLQVASSDLVDDLNADMVDGLDAADLVTHVQLDGIAVREALFTGDGTFDVPAGVNVLELIVIGGGGGGGGGPPDVDPLGFCSGGGGGSGYVVHTSVLVVEGEELQIDVGAGGAGGSVGGHGANGGPTSVFSSASGWRIVAPSGSGGQGANELQRGDGGSGFFGGGGGSAGEPLCPTSLPGSGGAGLFGDGEAGDVTGGGSGASGGVGQLGGGGGGPGGGNGGGFFSPQPGSQPGAGGGGGGDFDQGGGAGMGGSVLIRWVGPQAANS